MTLVVSKLSPGTARSGECLRNKRVLQRVSQQVLQKTLHFQMGWSSWKDRGEGKVYLINTEISSCYLFLPLQQAAPSGLPRHNKYAAIQFRFHGIDDLDFNISNSKITSELYIYLHIHPNKYNSGVDSSSLIKKKITIMIRTNQYIRADRTCRDKILNITAKEVRRDGCQYGECSYCVCNSESPN